MIEEILRDLFIAFVGGIVALIGQSLIPLIVARQWQWRAPAVYVTAKNTYIIKEKDVTNHRYNMILKLENGTDAPLSFSTPEFYIHNKLVQTHWEEAGLLTPPFTIGDVESGKAPLILTYSTSSCMDSPFLRRKICVNPHDFIETSITYNTFTAPKYYRKWCIGKPQIEGKLIIKPVGSTPITKTVYFNEIIEYAEA